MYRSGRMTSACCCCCCCYCCCSVCPVHLTHHPVLFHNTNTSTSDPPRPRRPPSPSATTIFVLPPQPRHPPTHTTYTPASTSPPTPILSTQRQLQRPPRPPRRIAARSTHHLRYTASVSNRLPNRSPSEPPTKATSSQNVPPSCIDSVSTLRPVQAGAPRYSPTRPLLCLHILFPSTLVMLPIANYRQANPPLERLVLIIRTLLLSAYLTSTLSRLELPRSSIRKGSSAFPPPGLATAMLTSFRTNLTTTGKAQSVPPSSPRPSLSTKRQQSSLKSGISRRPLLLVQL